LCFEYPVLSSVVKTMTSRRRRPMSGVEVLEQLFHDKDSDDSDIELGDGESDADDEQHVADDQDAVDADDSQLDGEDGGSVLNAGNDDDVAVTTDANDDDDDDADDDDAGVSPIPPKRSRLDDLWTWEKCDKDRKVQPPQLSVNQREELLADIPDDPSPYDFFKLYVTDDLLDLMVRETNRYAAQYIADNIGSLKPHSIVHKWKETDREEMSVLLGLLLHIGLLYKPRLSMYWSTDELFYTPVFSSVMSRDRFLILTRFLHFADNSCCDVSDPNRDRLYKIRPVIDFIKSRCRDVYYPSTELCVDESLVLFKGRLSFRQFIKTKRARFGIKIYQLCTSGGILLDFLVYHGHSSAELMQIPEFSITEKIPITLLQPYLNNGHILFTDNFYTTPRLAHYLLQNGTALVGTVRPNRKNFPKQLASTCLEKGEAEYFYTQFQRVLAVKYRATKDKAQKKQKIVHLLSTVHSNSMENSGKSDKDGTVIKKPSCIVAYNHSMGGVDLMDQQLDSLLVLRKSYKWYKKLFLRLILQCALSAHKLYKLKGGKLDFLNFLHDVCSSLLVRSPKLNQNVKKLDSLSRLTGRNHFPGKRHYEGTGSKRTTKVKQCRVCYARGIRTSKSRPIETTWICKGCPSQPGLCVETNCFEDYHTKVDYSFV